VARSADGPIGSFVGLTTLDLVHRLAAPAGRDEKVTAMRQDVQAGGPAANAAIAFTALGGSARLTTVLGTHPLAAAARADLAAWGVDVFDAAPSRTEPPPVSAVRVLDGTGERSVTSADDAGAEPTAAAPPPDGAVLVLDGWHAGLAVPAAQAARERGIPVLLGAGRWRPLVPELLPLVDYLIVSAAFPRDQLPAEAISAHTNGPDAITWHTPDSDGTLPVPHVEARDTLAAGDVFLGAAAFGIASRNRNWPAVLEQAAQVASRFVAEIGRDGLPRRAGIPRGPAR
jgi:sugar/nucleoside kinase (ribokinase family)